MKEKVAVVTVQGKPYFFVVNQLKEKGIPFISLIPGQPIPAKIRLVITTEQEKNQIDHEKILVFCGEEELDSLIAEVKKNILGVSPFDKIVVGIDPGVAIGLVAMADGKVLWEGNCFSSKELIECVLRILKDVNFEVNSVSVKIGNGVSVYKELLEELDEVLPPQVSLEVVDEAGTNKPSIENKHSRRVRHISSATRIAGRAGRVFHREKIAADNTSKKDGKVLINEKHQKGLRL
jgi:hypothetical protein